MKEFMTKMTNVWKAWSIRTKSVIVVTLALIVFVASGIFSTQPAPSPAPRFSVPYNIEEDIRRGSEYYLLIQNLSNESKPKYNQALLPASVARSRLPKSTALDIAFNANFDYLLAYQVQDMYDKVIQLDKALSGLLSERNPKGHKLDEVILEIDDEGIYIAMLYKDGCQMGTAYDYYKGVYSDVSSINGTLSYDKEQEILKYLNGHLDKNNK